MVTCPACGTPATNDDVFCANCGQRLPQAPSPGAAAQERIDTPPPMPGPPPITPGEPAAPPATEGGYPPPRRPVTPSYSAPPSQPSQGHVITPEVQPTSYQTSSPPYEPPPVTPAQAAQPPKKKLSGCVIAIIVVAALVICGIVIVGGIAILPELFPSNPPTSVPTNPPTPFPTNPPASTPVTDNTAPVGTSVPLDVVNTSGVSICFLYISPADSEYWGDDWLEEIGTIPAGASATFYLTSGDVVDMQAEDCNGNILDTQYDISVPAEGLTYTISGTPTTSSNNDTGPTGAQAPLAMVNESGETICYLYISPSYSSSWGEDWLDEIGTIPPGATELFYLTAGDVVDMKIEDCSGNVLDEQYDVTILPEGFTYTYGP
jgi:hypothetical protein